MLEREKPLGNGRAVGGSDGLCTFGRSFAFPSSVTASSCHKVDNFCKPYPGDHHILLQVDTNSYLTEAVI